MTYQAIAYYWTRDGGGVIPVPEKWGEGVLSMKRAPAGAEKQRPTSEAPTRYVRLIPPALAVS